MIKVLKLNYTRCCKSINTVMVLCYTCRLCCNGLNELSASSSKKKKIKEIITVTLSCKCILGAVSGMQCPAPRSCGWELQWVGAFPRTGAGPGWGAPKMGRRCRHHSSACCQFPSGEWVPVPIAQDYPMVWSYSKLVSSQLNNRL